MNVQATNVSRIFIALPLEASASQELAQWSQSSREQAHFRKWIHPLDYHITLQFLGNASDEQIEKLTESLHSISYRSFPVVINKAGTFGAHAAPKILWANAQNKHGELQQLQQLIVTQTSLLHFPAEERPFRPHITIARDYKGEAKFNLSSLPLISENILFQANHFCIMKTNLGKTPMYSALASFPLH